MQAAADEVAWQRGTAREVRRPPAPHRDEQPREIDTHARRGAPRAKRAEREAEALCAAATGRLLRAHAPARVLQVAQVGVAPPQEVLHLLAVERRGERRVDEPRRRDESLHGALRHRRVHEVGVLDDAAVALDVLLNLVLGREEEVRDTERRARREQRREIEMGVGQLVHGHRIAEAVREVVVPRASEVGTNLHERDRPAAGHVRQYLPAARRLVVMERRHGRGRRHEDGVPGQLREQSRMEQTVFSAAERSAAAHAGSKRLPGRERRVALQDLHRARRLAAATVRLERLDRGIHETVPQLLLAVRKSDRDIHAAWTQERPVGVKAEQGEPPPEGLRDSGEVDRVREPELEGEPPVEGRGRLDAPAERRRARADLGLEEFDAVHAPSLSPSAVRTIRRSDQ